MFSATGKYGCTKVRVYPAECDKQLGRDPSKNGSSKSLVLKSFSGEGTLWDASLPVTLTLWDTPVPCTPPLPLSQSWVAHMVRHQSNRLRSRTLCRVLSPKLWPVLADNSWERAFEVRLPLESWTYKTLRPVVCWWKISCRRSLSPFALLPVNLVRLCRQSTLHS